MATQSSPGNQKKQVSKYPPWRQVVSDVTAGVDDRMERLLVGEVELGLVHVIRLCRKINPAGKYTVDDWTMHVGRRHS